MSGYLIEQFPDEPILLVTYQQAWDFYTDSSPLRDAVWQALESANTPLMYIVDITIEPRFTLDDMMKVSRDLLRGSKPIMRHPNLREHLLITGNPVLHRALKALPWGRARSFETLDEALDYARRKLAD